MDTRFLAHAWRRLQFRISNAMRKLSLEIMSRSPDKSASLAANHHVHALSGMEQAPAQDTHHWHYSARRLEENQPFPM